MDANNWVGLACFALVVLATLAVLAGRLAGEWKAIKRWLRFRHYGFTRAEPLIATAHAYEALVPISERLRAERDHARRENARLLRDNDRLRARIRDLEREGATALHLPRLDESSRKV